MQSVGCEEILFNDNRKGAYGNKLCSYRWYKNRFGCKEYLSLCKNTGHRHYITKLRLSCHKLQIEVSRYSNEKLSPGERVCKLCDTQQCEDEKHFITTCKMYVEQRKVLFSGIAEIYPSFTDLDNNEFKF